jgi:cytochrome c biogenesis protein CcmG, thiol:disulfide interchange protein DsbE
MPRRQDDGDEAHTGTTGLRARWLAAAGIVALVLASGVALAVSARDDGSEATAPAHLGVEVELLDGGTTTLGDLRGRPVVVNFFASWCPPCVAEMPEFEAVHRDRSDEVAFVGLALQDSRDAAQALVEVTGVSYPVAADPDGVLFRQFGGVAMPTTVFLDADGRVTARHSGVLAQSQLQARIDDLLEGL